MEIITNVFFSLLNFHVSHYIVWYLQSHQKTTCFWLLDKYNILLKSRKNNTFVSRSVIIGRKGKGIFFKKPDERRVHNQYNHSSDSSEFSIKNG